MRALLAGLALALLAGCGGGTGETTTVTVARTATETVTETVAASPHETGAETEPQEPAGEAIPAVVTETRAALLAAAASGDYEELRPLVPDTLSYTFGESQPGGAVEYWQSLEAETDESPIRILAGLLQLPPSYFQGVYVWPFAYVYSSADELTDEDRALLRDVGGVDLSDDFGGGSGYLGWRAGIAPDGTWLYFVAGD